jgi:glycosyltransferase involved in cell wall biosynthesis
VEEARVPQPVRVSVVIPTYNYGHFLARAIDSVLDQTCPVFEIVVVDDGSQDNTREVAESFGNRVRYIFQENRGLSAARNTGIREARGEWVGLLDADDWWLPEKHQKVQELLGQCPDAVMIYHPSLLVAPDGRQRVRPVLEPDALWPALRHENWISGGSSALLRRSVLLDLGGFDESLKSVEDWDMWVRVALRHPLHKLSQPLSGVWTHAASMTMNHARMAEATRQIVDKTLSDGLHGIQRILFRQRILARVAFDASVELRSIDRSQSHRYLYTSLADWPSPFFLPKRWWSLCLALAGRV